MSGAVGSGRPLRFFLLVIAAWIGGRVTMQSPRVAPLVISAPLHQAAPAPIAKAPVRPYLATWASSRRIASLPRHAAPPRRSAPPALGGALDAMDFIRFTTAFSGRHYGASSALAALADTETARAPWPVAIPAAPPPGNDRWRASAWMLWRPEGAATPASLSGGQLGASQAGVRADYDITPHAPSRLAVYARASAALIRPAQPETALGMAFQPSRHLPISIAVERRVALDRTARNAMAMVIAGGFGPQQALPGVMVDGYAQTGVVGVRSRDAFIDGRFSITHPVDRTALAIGASLSGGAQPGVHRIDVGPALHLRLPTAPVTARVTMEWRERVSGQARPQSGLALTLAADF